MTPDDLIKFYGGTQLGVQRGTRNRIRQSTVSDWVRAGYVPIAQQFRIQEMTRGALQVDLETWRVEVTKRSRKRAKA